MADKETDAGPRYYPSLHGPYDIANGCCCYLHPVNGWGRCEPMNREFPTNLCPTRAERETYLLTQPVETVVWIAGSVGITSVGGIALSLLPLTNATRALLVPLIATAEGL